MVSCNYDWVFLVAKVLGAQEFDLNLHKSIAMCDMPERVSAADRPIIAYNKNAVKPHISWLRDWQRREPELCAVESYGLMGTSNSGRGQGWRKSLIWSFFQTVWFPRPRWPFACRFNDKQKFPPFIPILASYLSYNLISLLKLKVGFELLLPPLKSNALPTELPRIHL